MIVFYGAIVVGPFIAIAMWDRPPLVVGLAAGLLGFGVTARLFVEGFAARSIAALSRELGVNLEAQHRGWALVLRVILATVWLVPILGLWGSAYENAFHSGQAETAGDYASLALWQAGNAIPILDVPQVLGYPNAPVAKWSLGVGISLLFLGLVVVYSIVIVVAELVVGHGGRRAL